MRKEIDVRVRTAPKYGVFIAAGVVVGLIAALIVALLPTEPRIGVEEVTFASKIAFLSATLGIAGALLGAGVAVIIEKVASRRSRTYQVDAYFEPSPDPAGAPISGAKAGPAQPSETQPGPAQPSPAEASAPENGDDTAPTTMGG